MSKKTHSHIPGSEEELAVEVGLLDGVHVSHDNLSLPAGQAHHGKVLQQLTANGSSSDLMTAENFYFFMQWMLLNTGLKCPAQTMATGNGTHKLIG